MNLRQELVFPPTPCDAPEIGPWLAALADCRSRTLKVIAGLEVEELEWSGPHDRNSVGTLLYHVAAIELDWTYSEILARDFPADVGEWFAHDARGEDGALTVVTGEGVARHLDRLLYTRGKLVEELSRMTRMEFEAVRRLESYDVQPAWAVHHLLQHEAEHRAQMAAVRSRYRATRGSAAR